jgi:hypothetical protein
MTDSPTPGQLMQARIAVALVVSLFAIGAIWYGVSFQDLNRLWTDLLDRPGGPMTFRFILQPAMAALAALHDGVSDARLGRPPYAYALVRIAEGRSARLWEGIVSTARILILGVVVDAIYQGIVLHSFYPAQAAVIAILLAFVPYAILRGPIARFARLWITPSAPV